MQEINTWRIGDHTAIIQICGAMDKATVPAFKAVVSNVMDDGVRHLVLNLRNLEHLDLPGLATIVGLVKAVHDRGGTISGACACERVERLFQLSHVDKLVALYHDEQDALAAIPDLPASRIAERSPLWWCDPREVAAGVF